MAARFDAVIIGAGVAGLSTARRLLSLGASVTLVDSGNPGGASSRAAAGVCVPSVRLLDDLPMFEFTRAARTLLVEDLDKLDAPNLQRAQGVIRPAPDEKSRAALEEKGQRAPGHLGRWVTAEELYTLEPALKGGGFYGGFLNDDGFMLDVDRYLGAMLGDIGRRGGQVRLSEPVLEIREEGDHVSLRTVAGQLKADRLVVCAGAWTGQLPGLSPLPVKPQRGQLITVFHPTLRLSRILSGAAYIAPWRAGEIVVGATEEDVGFANHTTPSGMLFLTAYLSKLAPALKEARFAGHWSGLRSVGPGGRLMIGPVPGMRRTFVGTAQGGQGILTGAALGHSLGEWLTEGKSALAEPFDSGEGRRGAMTALWLDHASLTVPALAPALVLFERLGFELTVTPLAAERHSRLLLDRTYLEVSARADRPVAAPIFRLFFFKFEDRDATEAALRAKGVAGRKNEFLGVDGTWEELEVLGPHGTPAPILVRRRTPEAIASDWPPPRQQPHLNGARTLQRVLLRVARLEEARAFYEKLLPDAQVKRSGTSLDLGPVRLTQAGPGETPVVAGVELGVDSVDATEAFLRQRGVRVLRVGDTAAIDPAETGGVLLSFAPTSAAA